MCDLEGNLGVTKAALNLYDFDPDGTGQTPTEAADERNGSSVGSLAGFDERDTA